jgi:P2 family phage contractile tail tube protein
MGKVDINRVTNAGIYLESDSFVGKAEEITLPSIKAIMSEHKALGMMSKVEFFAGLEKMEGKIKFNSKYAEAVKIFANPIDFKKLQVKYLLTNISAGGPVGSKGLVIMTIQSKGIEGGAFKPQDNVEISADFNVLYYKETIGGVTVVEVDVLANIFKVGGKDLSQEFRAAVGG